MLGVDAIEARAHQRLSIAFAAHRGVAADHREIPMRFPGVMSLHLIEQLAEFAARRLTRLQRTQLIVRP